MISIHYIYYGWDSDFMKLRFSLIILISYKNNIIYNLKVFIQFKNLISYNIYRIYLKIATLKAFIKAKILLIKYELPKNSSLIRFIYILNSTFIINNSPLFISCVWPPYFYFFFSYIYIGQCVTISNLMYIL